VGSDTSAKKNGTKTGTPKLQTPDEARTSVGRVSYGSCSEVKLRRLAARGREMLTACGVGWNLKRIAVEK